MLATDGLIEASGQKKRLSRWEQTVSESECLIEENRAVQNKLVKKKLKYIASQNLAYIVHLFL